MATLGNLPSDALVVPRVTALPGSPSDGDLVRYVADATNKIDWLLQFYATDSKWQFLGGPELVASVDADEARNNTAYGALATAGPSITVPLAGDYRVQVGFRMKTDTTNVGKIKFHSYDVGATGALDADAAVATPMGIVQHVSPVSPPRTKAGLAASTAIVSKYRDGISADSVGTFGIRWMTVRPIRVS